MEWNAMSYNILIIDDSNDVFCYFLKKGFEHLGHKVTLAHDGTTGYEQAMSNCHDLILLDLMLPDIDGLEVCKRIRSASNYTPIIMLTAKSDEFDKVLGLEVGADDYITKPFSFLELTTRIKAIFRRIKTVKTLSEHDRQERIQIDGIVIDPEKRLVTLNETAVYLTAKEFDILYHFAKHPGRVYTRMQLLNAVWDDDFHCYTHVVDSHVNRLRSKIEPDPNAPVYIKTVWGVGYKFADNF
jgi:DNA-binding response OmpR family regulator